MKALIAANERAMGGNIVDLRGIAMERLEERLDRLEDTHRSVIAAAYENLAGTNSIHRAVLRLLEPLDFEAFLRDLGSDVAAALQVDCVKLVLETVQDGDDPAVTRLGEVLVTAEPGFIHTYLTYGRDVPVRSVTLRQVSRPRPRSSMATPPAGSARRPACGSTSAPAGCRGCWCWAARIRISSAPPMAPICWPSSATCSNGRCDGGWHSPDHDFAGATAMRWRGWLEQLSALGGRAAQDRRGLSRRRSGLSGVPHRAFRRTCGPGAGAEGRHGGSAGLDGA